MKLVLKINQLVNKYMLSMRKVALECKIRPATFKMYCDNTLSRINIEDLENLYNFFHKLDDRITISDLLEFVPSDNE